MKEGGGEGVLGNLITPNTHLPMPVHHTNWIFKTYKKSDRRAANYTKKYCSRERKVKLC